MRKEKIEVIEVVDRDALRLYEVIIDGKLYKMYRHNAAWEVIDKEDRPVEDEGFRRGIIEAVVSDILKK